MTRGPTPVVSISVYRLKKGFCKLRGKNHHLIPWAELERSPLQSAIPLSVDETPFSNYLTYSKWPILSSTWMGRPPPQITGKKESQFCFVFLFFSFFSFFSFSSLWEKVWEGGGGEGCTVWEMNEFFYTPLFVVIAHHTHFWWAKKKGSKKQCACHMKGKKWKYSYHMKGKKVKCLLHETLTFKILRKLYNKYIHNRTREISSLKFQPGAKSCPKWKS